MANNKSKILIVEDDKYYSRAYKDGFEDAGFTVVSANDGKEGLGKIKSDKPDLVLLDLLMPVEGGFEVLEELRMDDEAKAVPVIILSNLGQDSDIQRAKELGAADYLMKSDLTMKEVIAKVKEHIAKRIK